MVIKFELPKLHYGYNALEPWIDAKTVEIHHDKHHQTYCDKFNEALAKHPELNFRSGEEVIANLGKIPDDIRVAVRNSGGGFVNHNFYWEILTGDKKYNSFEGRVAEAIIAKWESFDKFREEFSASAMGRFGSGWAWLVLNKGHLEIMSTANQDSPLSEGKMPLLTIDVWEHSYYLKYINKRADYVSAFWNVVNWKKVNENYLNAIGV